MPPWVTVIFTVPLADLSQRSLRATFLDALSLTVAVPAEAALPLPLASLRVPSLRPVALSAVIVPLAEQAAVQAT